MSFESSLNLKLRLLLDGLRVGELHRLDNAMLDPQALADVLGADDFAQLEQDMNHEARLLQLCFASMFVGRVRQCFSAVWADGFPRCRHRFPVM